MKRKLLVASVGLLLAVLLLSVGMFLLLRLWPFDGKPEHAVLAAKGSAMFFQWVVCPITTVVVALIARLIARCSSWALSAVVVLPMAVVNMVLAFDVSGIAAACVCMFSAYATMMVLDALKKSPTPLT